MTAIEAIRNFVSLLNGEKPSVEREAILELDARLAKLEAHIERDEVDAKVLLEEMRQSRR